jgi:hypothetical protein
MEGDDFISNAVTRIEDFSLKKPSLVSTNSYFPQIPFLSHRYNSTTLPLFGKQSSDFNDLASEKNEAIAIHFNVYAAHFLSS